MINLTLYKISLMHHYHYGDVIMGEITSQVTSLSSVYSTLYSDADQRKYQSSASLAFVWGIHRGPVNSPHKRPVTRKMSPFDDVIMFWFYWYATTTGMIMLCKSCSICSIPLVFGHCSFVNKEWQTDYPGIRVKCFLTTFQLPQWQLLFR